MLTRSGRKLALLASLAFICVYVRGQQAAPDENSFSSIIHGLETKLQKDIADDSLQESISVAIVHKNQIIWSKAFGYADRENKISADTATIYRVASLTKPFTAMCLMQMVEKRVLKLDDPVEMYLPEIKKLKGYKEAHKITFFQLATHTAGLEREPQLEDARKGAIEDWENKVLECIPATAIKSRPGKKFNYSNIGYSILGLALERAAKKSYIHLITENIFIPLQMNSSFFIISPLENTKFAKGLTVDSGKIKQVFPLSMNGYSVPAGSIYSTANDYSKFLMANMGFYSLCTDESRALMQTGIKPPLSFLKMTGIKVLAAFLSGKNKQIARTAIHSKYGIGLSVYKFKDTKIVEHSGLLPGYSSQFSFDAGSQYGIILFRNSSSGKTHLHAYSFEILTKLKGLDN